MSFRQSTRINKYISESGMCSRREADRFVEQGNVWINGRRATTGDQVAPGDRVKVNGQEIEPTEDDDFVLIALNKPPGIVSTTDSSEKANIVDFVGHGARIFPIGRLDKDSEGLIFLTSNGDLVNKILRAGNNHEKEYRVTVDKPITERFIDGMQQGVPILGQVTKRCRVEKVSANVFDITLVQGLNRQIRRMCEYFGYEVTRLVRNRIMNVSLKGLALGDWRDLTPKEIDGIVAQTQQSEKVADKGRSAHGKPASKTGAKSHDHASGKRSAASRSAGGAKSKTSGKGGAAGRHTAKSGAQGSAKPPGKGGSATKNKPATKGKPSASGKAGPKGTSNATKGTSATKSKPAGRHAAKQGGAGSGKAGAPARKSGPLKARGSGKSRPASGGGRSGQGRTKR
ncbi:23S rRNA pseudouridine(2604) synthase RluF [Larsenimonas salina]|uniref:23S rRNA pseudouridine(2604) synthase RluF n=1 Tax=Larsenimonas salina TaxID=1295565 RepID=UPI0020738CD9|nr:23S rRNA pseudouridine(2604) synthase RluF [Larsenimonas salina]MCM5704619.1 23S rRNA pseudouridine(2604) synthase RluF [Larsenimonas salina]